MAYHLASGGRLLKQDTLPLSLPVEASTKINALAISYFETTGRPDGAPRESYQISDFRSMRPEHDVTYAFGHTYNHYHRCVSLLRSMFQESRYRGISRTPEPVELTVCERH